MLIIILIVEFDGCSSEVDAVWNIKWPNTLRGATALQLCPGGQTAIGTS